MDRVIPLSMLLLTLFVIPAASEEKPGQEVKGTWLVVRLQLDGKDITENLPSGAQLVLEDQKARFETSERTSDLGTYYADSRGTPKIIDFTQTDAQTGEKSTREGIYKLEGDRLTICVQGKIQEIKERPSEFSADAGSGLVLVTFKRAN